MVFFFSFHENLRKLELTVEKKIFSVSKYITQKSNGKFHTSLEIHEFSVIFLTVNLQTEAIRLHII